MNQNAAFLTSKGHFYAHNKGETSKSAYTRCVTDTSLSQTVENCKYVRRLL